MDIKLITGIATLMGVIATFVVAYINNINTTKNLKRAKYLDLITNEKLKRIENLRLDFSSFLAKLIEHNGKTFTPEIQSQIINIIANIKTKLNIDESEKLVAFLDRVENIVKNNEYVKIDDAIISLFQTSSVILENRWEEIVNEIKYDKVLEKSRFNDKKGHSFYGNSW